MPQNQNQNEPTKSETSEPVGAPKSPQNKAIVRTFKDDIQHLVRNKKASLTRIAAMESKRRGEEGEVQKADEKPKRALVIVALAVLFVVIASVFALGTYYAYRLNTTAPTQQLDPSFIFIEAQEQVDITGIGARGVVELLASVRRNTFFSLGSMIDLYITTRMPAANERETIEHVPQRDFLERIDARVPTTFLQTLGEDYMLGIHVLDENTPFLLLTTRSYGHAFSGMLAWEKSIEEDLLPFFSPQSAFIKPAVAADVNVFEDTIIDNIDVRILHDEDGVARMMYAFIGHDAIVITTDTRTLTELADRVRVR